ncbi:BnaCnng10070D [Brassica napus]|uniref:BnaCnng10070D protein n=1 Tax=Brassica napus TaxID=3708 RepID=A0A078HUC4_BRANA|nr:BnaCnng10070D [Brassica napus]
MVHASTAIVKRNSG